MTEGEGSASTPSGRGRRGRASLPSEHDCSAARARGPSRPGCSPSGGRTGGDAGDRHGRDRCRRGPLHLHLGHLGGDRLARGPPGRAVGPDVVLRADRDRHRPGLEAVVVGRAVPAAGARRPRTGDHVPLLHRRWSRLHLPHPAHRGLPVRRHRGRRRHRQLLQARGHPRQDRRGRPLVRPDGRRPHLRQRAEQRPGGGRPALQRRDALEHVCGLHARVGQPRVRRGRRRRPAQLQGPAADAARAGLAGVAGPLVLRQRLGLVRRRPGAVRRATPSRGPVRSPTGSRRPAC